MSTSESRYRGMSIERARRSLADAISPVFDQREARAVALEALRAVTRLDSTGLIIKADQPLSDFAADSLEDITNRLLRNEPIQYILGVAHWHGLDFTVTHDTLIPRPETSQLVDLIVDRFHSMSDLQILDLCTGSGCIAIALALALPFSQVSAIDISQPALVVAETNAKALRARVRFERADALQMPPEPHPKFDIITANPPYVLWGERADMEPRVLDHEPQSALFVPDNDPLIFYRAILIYSRSAIKPDGAIYFEINPLQAKPLLELAKSKFPGADIDIIKDIHGRDRFMSINVPVV